MTITHVKFAMTCEVCPEQYDAFINDENIGYLRLRHGRFTVDYKNDTIFTAYPEGDGCFEYDERDKYLKEATMLLLNKYNEENNDGFGFDILSSKNVTYETEATWY